MIFQWSLSTADIFPICFCLFVHCNSWVTILPLRLVPFCVSHLDGHCSAESISMDFDNEVKRYYEHAMFGAKFSKVNKRTRL